MKHIIFILLIFPIAAVSHEFVESVECPKPVNSGRISSQVENEMFQAQLILYERCMFEYILKQQDLSDVHQQAAQRTLEEWNNFLTSRMQ